MPVLRRDEAIERASRAVALVRYGENTVLTDEAYAGGVAEEAARPKTREEVTAALDAAGLFRLYEVIEKCCESAGLQPSPDGPTGDITNLLHRGDVAEARAGRLRKAGL